MGIDRHASQALGLAWGFGWRVGAGVVLGNAIPECVALAEKLDAPVCNNYQHNDSFPGSHRLNCAQ